MADLNQPRVIEPVFRTGYNNTGATIPKGTIVKLQTAAPARGGDVIAAAAATDNFYGVAAQDIATKSFGDVQIEGTALVLSGGAIALGQNLTSDGNGNAVNGASGNVMLGMATSTAGASGELVECELATPGGRIA